MRTILHVDMDAFYASIEQRDRPELRGKPVIVGGPSRRGVVAAASYEVRRFGVRSAMPMVEALRRCPGAIVLGGRHARYAEVSGQVFAIFQRYTPLVEGLSLDEAFLDVTMSRALFGDGPSIAERIRTDIRRELSLTASAGVASSKFVAKLASDLNKPDGLTVVPPDVRAFLAPLPLERMWGVGPTAAAKLHALGMDTIGDLADADADQLAGILGSWGVQVQGLARGQDARPVVPGHEAKSIGSEQTFERDLRSRDELERHLLAHASRVATRLEQSGLWARTVRIKVKYADFSVRTRQSHLEAPVMDTDAIFSAARALIEQLPTRDDGIRLAGVTAADLNHGPAQGSLFPDPARTRAQRLEVLKGEVARRFGANTLTRARLIEPAHDKKPAGATRRRPQRD